MAGYRVFKLRTSASDEHDGHARWADYGMVELPGEDDSPDPASLGEQFGDGEYLVVPEEHAVIDYTTPAKEN